MSRMGKFDIYIYIYIIQLFPHFLTQTNTRQKKRTYTHDVNIYPYIGLLMRNFFGVLKYFSTPQCHTPSKW